jgi:hypothetical protein
MIKILFNENDQKVNQIDFEYDDFKKLIFPNVYSVFDNKNGNIGRILEDYRKLKENADEFYLENKPILDDFVKNYNSPFTDIYPDCVVCFLPVDINRKHLLIDFKEKILGLFENKNEIDFSVNFIKKDPIKSIKHYDLNKNDFNLTIERDKPFKSVIVIDDVINEGKTLGIFLEMMKDKNLIDGKTEVNGAFIYCFKQIKRGHMDAVRKLNYDK